MTSLRRLLIISLVIVLAGMTVLSQTEKTGVFEFPDVDGWSKSEITHYPQAGLGYSINYESNIGGRVTVYIYDVGNPSIPDGIESEVVKAEIERVRQEIFKLVELGYYENAEILKEGSAVLGGESGSLDILRTVLSLTIEGREMTSEIYLFGMDNNFVKFRATRSREIEGLQNKAIVELWAALDKYFISSPKPVLTAPGPGDKTGAPINNKKINN